MLIRRCCYVWQSIINTHLTLHTSVASLGAGVLLIVYGCHTPLFFNNTWRYGHVAHRGHLSSSPLPDAALTEWLGVLDITCCFYPALMAGCVPPTSLSPIQG
jgi:hypothetical protein